MKKTKLQKCVKHCWLAMLLAAVVAAQFGKGSTGYAVCFMVGIALGYLSLGFTIALLLTPENKKARAENRAFRVEDHRPVAAELISTEYRYSKLKGLCRAAIGDWLAGTLGAYAWAYTTPGTEYATFAVKYATGRIGTETVEVGGKRFNELSALLRD